MIFYVIISLARWFYGLGPIRSAEPHMIDFFAGMTSIETGLEAVYVYFNVVLPIIRKVFKRKGGAE